MKNFEKVWKMMERMVAQNKQEHEVSTGGLRE
jgi:hypothetical protein